MDVQETLAQRQGTHGSFKANAECAQGLCSLMQQQQNWKDMPAVHCEALEAIQRKIARLVCGNSFNVDSVRDIIGYAQLYMNDLLSAEGAIDVKTTSLKRSGNAWVQDTCSP
jgi:hypothetical protein